MKLALKAAIAGIDWLERRRGVGARPFSAEQVDLANPKIFPHGLVCLP